MALCQVFNDNVHPYSEKFRGDMVTIPAKGSIEMEWEDANQFAAQYGHGSAPIGPNGKPDARYFKMIRVPYPKKPVVEDDGLINHATGKKADSVAELAEMLKEFAGARAPDGAGPKTAELAELKALVAQQQQMLQALIDDQAKRKAASKRTKEWKAKQSSSLENTSSLSTALTV